MDAKRCAKATSSYVPGWARRFLAIPQMPRSTDFARSCAPDLFLPATTCRMPRVRPRSGPQATCRVKNKGPQVEASWMRLTHTARARNLRSTSLWASYRHHDIVVLFFGAPRGGLQLVAPDALEQVGKLLHAWSRDGALCARCKTAQVETRLRCTFVTF